ncbi:hypothetical protein BLD25_01765 [Candidatus Gracilibacteria bacterium GN02-872]|nr:hypothetical protein BLD25_01765 [Candidatus Gracilibacteria bacterium GN02-872]
MNNNLKKLVIASAISAGLSGAVNAQTKEIRDQIDFISSQNIGHSFGDLSNSLGVSIETLEGKTIVGVKFLKVGEKAGALLELKGGKDYQSVFLTGTWNGKNMGLKATVGEMQKELTGIEISGKKATNIFAGVEGVYKLNEKVALGAYINHTQTQDKNLEYFSEQRLRLGEKPAYVTNERWTKFDGYGKTSFGLSAEYLPNENNKFSANIGYSKADKSGVEGKVAYYHLTNDNKTELGIELSGSKDYKEAKALVSRYVAGNLELNANAGIREIRDKSEGFVGAGFNYSLDKKRNSKYNGYTSDLKVDPKTHVQGASEASKVLYGKVKNYGSSSLSPIENVAPTILSIEGKKDLLTNEEINLIVNIFDKDKDLLQQTVVLKAVNLPEGLKISGNRLTGKISKAGKYVVVVYANDGIADSAPEAIVLNIIGASVPSTPYIPSTPSTPVPPVTPPTPPVPPVTPPTPPVPPVTPPTPPVPPVTPPTPPVTPPTPGVFRFEVTPLTNQHVEAGTSFTPRTVTAKDSSGNTVTATIIENTVDPTRLGRGKIVYKAVDSVTGEEKTIEDTYEVKDTIPPVFEGPGIVLPPEMDDYDFGHTIINDRFANDSFEGRIKAHMDTGYNRLPNGDLQGYIAYKACDSSGNCVRDETRTIVR